MSRAQESPSIESAMERLEKLIEEMEGEAIPLEKLITRYEEGVSLVRLCQEKLDAAEQKIQLITRKATGPDGLKNFPNGTDES
jgi:exodeoxyribonuclease VII small subunit